MPLSNNHETAARQVDKMEKQLNSDLPKNLSAEDQEKLTKFVKEQLDKKRDEKIYFSKQERLKFVRDLKTEALSTITGGTTHEGEKLEKLKRVIAHHIKSELFDTRLSEAANYEGWDFTYEQKDQNAARNEIENAYEAASVNMHDGQRAELEKQILELVKKSHIWNIDSQGKIATHVDKHHNKDIKVSDYVLTLAEAKQIAAKIPEIAESLANMPKEKAKTESGETADTGTPDQKMEAAAVKLKANKTDVQSWYSKDTPIDENIRKKINPTEPELKNLSEEDQAEYKARDIKLQKSLELLSKWGMKLDINEMQNATMRLLSGQLANENKYIAWGKEKAGQKSDTSVLGEVIVNRLEGLTKTIQDSFSDETGRKAALGKFLELKGLQNATAEQLVQYIAFTKVGLDMPELVRYMEAKNKTASTEDKIQMKENAADNAEKIGKKSEHVPGSDQDILKNNAWVKELPEWAQGFAVLLLGLYGSLKGWFGKTFSSLASGKNTPKFLADTMKSVGEKLGFIEKVDIAQLTKKAEGWTTDKVKAKIIEEANSQGVPVKLALAVAEQESGLNAKAVSPAGAVGVMQLMSGAAQDQNVDRYDVAQNIQGGVGYLKRQLDAFNGNTELALAAYNAGAGAVRAAGNKVPNFKETKNYVKSIMKNV